MSRWVYWLSLIAIATVILYPVVRLSLDPQAQWGDIFRQGIDLAGGTSLIYDLHSTDPAAPPPDASEAKKVIMARIDPSGTRGYIVRALGAHRLEIVLPGRATRVDVTPEAVTADLLAAAEKAAIDNKNPDAAALLKAKSQTILGQTVLHVRLNPALYMQDIQDRIQRALLERMPDQVDNVAIVSLVGGGDQTEVQIFVPAKAGDAEAVGAWSKLVEASLSAQRDVTEVKRLVRQSGFLEFRIVVDRNGPEFRGTDFDALVKAKQNNTLYDTSMWGWYPMKNGWERVHGSSGNALATWGFVYVEDAPTKTVQVLVNVGDGQNVTGADLARAVPSSQDGRPIVAFDMRSEATARFGQMTNPRMVGRHMAIILDGVIQTAPVLQATLTGGGVITGYDDRREVEEVVRVLNSGKLAASLGDPVTTRTVGPELGADNIRNGLRASLIGLVIVMLFMGIYYLFAGAVANLALILNLILTVCIMFWIRQAWTLPGIAGLILALAMAVDANVLIYERLREEKGKEGSLGFALKKAYARAFTTIFDSNLTTVIPAVVLLMGLATEEVKGFALVMVIGLGVSMFTAVVVTRMIFETGIKWGLIKELKMLHFFEKPNIDWMKFARYAFIVTIVLSVAGVIVFLSRGDEKYDIEFSGGTQVELALKPPTGQTKVPIELVRQRANEAIGGEVTIQELEYAGEVSATPLSRFLISVSHAGAKVSTEADVKQALAVAFKDMQPPGAKQDAEATATMVTAEMLRQRVEGPRPAVTTTTAPAATHTAPAATGTAAATTGTAPAAVESEAPSAEYIPENLRLYLGKVCVTGTVSPPMPLGEIQRRIDLAIHEGHPELATMAFQIEPGEVGPAGTVKSFRMMINDSFNGVRTDVPTSKFWTDIVTTALRREEAFASTNSVAPTMASEAWNKAVIAILFSLAAMAIYIWFRFAKFSSGVAAIVATVHDVLVALGAVTAGSLIAGIWGSNVLMLTDMKINLPLIGAFLTLVGYSVNDTIVVFDRIRENRGKYGDLSPAIINNSINQTLSRTVLTSSTVFLAVVALYFFGGATSSIHGLAFVMLVGTIIGCYSSIAIASPILVMTGYMKRVYAWSYPIVGAGLLAYFACVWMKPDAFFVTPAALAAAVVAIAWIIVATWGAFCITHGRPWTLYTKTPVAARVVAGLSLLAPVLTVVFFAAAVLGTKTTGVAAWAGPAAVGALATCPATYMFYRLVRRKRAGQNS